MKYKWIGKGIKLLKRIDAAIEARIVEQDLRRLANEFALCFLSSSVAGFRLRNQKASDETKRLSISLLNRSACSHQRAHVCSLQFRIAEFVKFNRRIYLLCIPNRTMY